MILLAPPLPSKHTPAAWMMALCTSFLFPVPFSAWVTSAERYWVILAKRRRPAQWEDEIARASIGAERSSQIQLIVASPGAYQKKFDAALILFTDENGVYRTAEFFKVASAVKNVLSAMNPARARIRVMCSSALSLADSQRIKRASVAVLGS